MIHTGDIDKKGTIDIKKQSSPKSPYPPNSMSESVAHIVGNASDIKDLKEELKQEIVDRKDGDQQLADDIASIEQAFPILDEAIQNLEESDEKLQSNIDAEKERATKRENEIEDSIDAETARATAREDELEKAIGEAGKIDDVKVDGTSVVTDKVANIDLQPIRDSISAEEARAKAVEKTLTDGLSTEAAARENADATIQSNLDKEITRASAKETELGNSVSSGLAAEKKAREDADNLLQSNIDAEASTRETNDNALQTNIDEEASERKKADETLQSNLASETTRAKEAEKKLTTDLSTEATTRETNDNTLQTNIDAEATRAKDAEKTLTDDLTAEASTRQTNDETLQSNIDAEAQTRYDADDSLGIQIAFQTQRAESAIGSLRTTVADEISDREAADSALQTSIDAEVSARKAADESLQSGIDSINSKIPEQASSSNQLADKDYVNSSIATSTATFRGTVDSLDALKALTGDLNDYAFIEVKDETTGLTLRYDRYKYSDVVSTETGNWAFEYTLNNSSFTSDQWKAITSGITSDLVAQITENKDAIAQEITDREDAIYNVELNVDTEKYRAQREENDIRSNLDAEISRAQAKETELEDAISKAGKIDDVQVNGTSVVTDKVANIDLTDYVTLSTDQTITGLKTFAAPAYMPVEQATAIYNTSNGGRIIFGKSGANSGTMIAVEQKAGTRRLNFRASTDSSAMVWEQPESSSNLYFDVNAVHFRKGTSITFGENSAYAQAIFFKQLTSADYLYTDSKGTLTKGTFDDAPTADSTNPVTSDGIKSYVDSSASDTLTASKAYTDQEKANYVLKSGDTMTGTLNVPTINNYNTSTVVSMATGTNASSYLQARKFRGQGDANTYNHAIDFGYAGHDRVDFYEYGGVFNFWANRGTSKLEGDGNRVASLQSGKILERGNTLTYPGKSGTFALTDDVTDGDAQTLTDAKVYVDQQISVIEIDGGEVSQ